MDPIPVLVFGLSLLLAVLTSALASRSPLSTSAVFLGTGLVAGPLGLGIIGADRVTVELMAEIALFAVLFADGQHAPWRVMRHRWGPPALSLLVGMPLTFAIVTALGHWVAGLPWVAAAVLGAVLAPTDPVFASALVGRDDVPRRVRNLLNVESGFNDGLALPAVLLFIGLAGGDPHGWTTEPWILLLEVLGGVALGLVVPFVVWLVLSLPGVGATPQLRPLGPTAVAILLFGLSDVLHANQFLAAFVAGATVATLSPEDSAVFRRTGELASEIAKGAALLAFATLLDVGTLVAAGWTGLVLAAGVLLLARPLPVALVLQRSPFSWRETASVAWFGPKGFASVAYAVIVAGSGMPWNEEVLALTAVTVLVSVLAHSSTDVAVATWLGRAGNASRPSERAA